MVGLDYIARQTRTCTLCPLHEHRTLAVPGEGPVDAKAMLVGESPGDEEDRQGRPFVGRSGEVLDEALRAVGIGRESVFITNVVKCHPPHNRLPHQPEVSMCISHYLYAQIGLINPTIVCLLGGTAAHALLGETQLTVVRGKVVQRERPYFVTYHPAAAGRHPQWRKDFLADMQKLAALINEGG